MNSDIEKEIDSLVGDLPEADKKKAREILESCQFQDAGDPVFGLLRFFQLRRKALVVSERPLAAIVAKLAGEMDNRLWEARRYQWGLFVGCIFIAFLAACFLVGGFFFHEARVDPVWMSNYLRLPAQYELVHDARLVRLQNAGVGLRVSEEQSYIGVELRGDQPEYVQTNGQALVVFHKRQ